MNNTNTDKPNITEQRVPICVDLDGTLLRSDLLLEALFVLLKQQIGLIFLLPFWLLRGKAHFKHQIAQRVDLDVSVLPYNQPFLEHLQTQRQNGQHLILATASHQKYAEQVAVHLGIFDAVLASNEQVNLSGDQKLARLLEHYGEKGFDYAGNAYVDLKIWPRARQSILVNPAPGLTQAAQRCANVTAVFADPAPGISTYLQATRVYQWLKNLLIFVPLLAAHKLTDIQLVTHAVLAFLAFGLCASSAYLLNDLLDLTADRHHPRKRLRALASGTLPIIHGAMLVPLLLVAGFGITFWLPLEFFAVLLLYFIATLAYSFVLKRIVILDVVTLAGLYTVRILAGAAAITVAPSFWLLAFSMFLFFSLALVKRYAEMIAMQASGKATLRGRGYLVSDLPSLDSLGAASGLMAVLVLALYINSPEIRTLYSHPHLIWLICPILLYWVSRVWLLAGRGLMHDDPIIFALRDGASRWIALVTAILLYGAK